MNTSTKSRNDLEKPEFETAKNSRTNSAEADILTELE